MGKITRWVALSLLGLLGFSLTACQKGPPWKPPPPIVESTPLPKLPQLASTDNINDYKALVATQILQANPNITFSGKLPPMLPAIVVVNISVDARGELTRVVVQRSRDSAASTVALAAVKQGGQFPMPQHLLLRGHRTLDFSETFLFGDRYRFKLRTLAGPQ
jgi:protein TonB